MTSEFPPTDLQRQQKQKMGNLGQKDAEKEKQAESEMSKMGEKTKKHDRNSNSQPSARSGLLFVQCSHLMVIWKQRPISKRSDVLHRVGSESYDPGRSVVEPVRRRQ